MSEEVALSVTVDEVRRRILADEELLLLDCRRAEEHALVHLAKSLLIPMDEIPQRVNELEQHRERNIVVYCHMGMRSELVARWLRSEGFPNTQTMAGGIDEWAVRIDSSLTRY